MKRSVDCWISVTNTPRKLLILSAIITSSNVPNNGPRFCHLILQNFDILSNHTQVKV